MQQTQISLDFDDIFNNHNRSAGQSPQSRILYQSFTQNNQHKEASENHNQTMKSLVDSTTSLVPFFHRHKLVHSASQQISSLNKLMFNCFAVKVKKPKWADIDKITKRLTETKSCKKIDCLYSTHSKQQITKANREKKKVQLSKSKSMDAYWKVESLSSTNVFDRLHFKSKIKNLKRLESKQECHSRLIDQASPINKKSKRSSTSQKYLKNYIPFNKRLQAQLNRTFQRAQLIKKHPKIVSQLQNMTFQPKLYSSPYSKTVKSRYMNTGGKEYTDKDLVHLMNSSANTSSQAINRSLQIIDRIQQHFFNKMRLIFVNEQTGQVKVSHQSISLLSQVEFSILSTFIMYIQENQIRADDFDYYLRSYFYNLSILQKMQLRSHQNQSRFKYTQFDQLHKTNLKVALRNSQKSAIKMTSGSAVKGHHTSRLDSNYHLTIQQYI